MTLGIVLGCLLGGALVLLVLAIWPPRPSLAQSLARWERQRSQQLAVVEGAAVEEKLSVRFGRRLVTEFAQRGVTFDKLRANLAIIDRPLEVHMARKCGFALFGLLLPTLATTVVYAATGTLLPFTIPTVVGLILAAVLFIAPDLTVAQEAEERRADLRRALSAYLDLVSMSLTGGRGVPEALPSAARICTGWGFQLLRNTIDEARYAGEPPWSALAELGERTAVQELVDLGGAITLVAEDGSKVKESLSARASAQRQRQLAEDEGAAAKSDQTMQVAQIVLAAGFFLFIGFPALYAVLAT